MASYESIQQLRALDVTTNLTDEQLAETIDSFKHEDILAASVLLKKYCVKDNKGNHTEWTLSHCKERWTKTISEVDKNFNNPQSYEAFRELYDYLIPGGRQMFALGNPYKQNTTLANCYVIGIQEDSIEGIFDTAKKAARIYSYGGGVGINLSPLRPSKSIVSNSAEISTGAASFMDLYSYVTGLIGQRGRRGALMLAMRVDHPDIELFTRMKYGNTDKVQYANVSVMITDEFMRAVEQDKDFTTSFTTHHETIEKTFRARDLWKIITKAARDSAEPGLLFWDNAINMSTSDVYGDKYRIICTNPCGEQLLENAGNCTLSSLNLYAFVKNPFSNNPVFDLNKFKIMTAMAVRHLDNICELSLRKQPLTENLEQIRNTRRIGLGITGLADMLVAMNIKYDSDEALEFVENIMKFKRDTEYRASIQLASERGPFPVFDPEKHFTQGFTTTLPKDIISDAQKYGLRNIAISTVPPVGSGSIITQTSSGMEPIFQTSYTRYTNLGHADRQEFTVLHTALQDYQSSTSKEDTPDIFVCAHEIDYNFRLKMQSIIQKYVDSSLSSTLNLPEDTSIETVQDIYMKAWKYGLKGVTVYREGSRQGILKTKKDETIPEVDLDTKTHKIVAEGGDKFYIHVSYMHGDIAKPYQIFIINYKQSNNDKFNKLARDLKDLASTFADEHKIVQQNNRSKNNLDKITRFISLGLKYGKLKETICILDRYAIVGTLAFHLKRILKASIEQEQVIACEECGGNLIYENGCNKCNDCGWSKCS